jgi:hypothetical protein
MIAKRQIAKRTTFLSTCWFAGIMVWYWMIYQGEILPHGEPGWESYLGISVACILCLPLAALIIAENMVNMVKSDSADAWLPQLGLMLLSVVIAFIAAPFALVVICVSFILLMFFIAIADGAGLSLGQMNEQWVILSVLAIPTLALFIFSRSTFRHCSACLLKMGYALVVASTAIEVGLLITDFLSGNLLHSLAADGLTITQFALVSFLLMHSTLLVVLVWDAYRAQDSALQSEVP